MQHCGLNLRDLLVVVNLRASDKFQEEWLFQASRCGHKAHVCFGYKDAINVIVAYLGIKEDNPWKAYKDKYAKMPKQWDHLK